MPAERPVAEAAGPIEVVPATVERWDDVALLLGGDGAAGCWCQPWRGTSPGFGRAEAGTRPALLRGQMERAAAAGPAAPPPGFLAYLDGQPVGWVGVAVRTEAEAPRLANSKVIPRLDAAAVWSIGCFRIRTGYRRRGVATALLDGVVAAARAAGAPGVEAYPIDPEGRRVDVGFAFVGIASMFDRAGFRRARITDARSAGLPRWLVRLDLGDGDPSGASTD